MVVGHTVIAVILIQLLQLLQRKADPVIVVPTRDTVTPVLTGNPALMNMVAVTAMVGKAPVLVITVASMQYVDP
jgi:hypothetical protein